MYVVIGFFVAHWLISIFFQTFFHHRYGAHRMFTMSPGWERFFYVSTWLAQGSSFLNPRAYAILHREHHAFSDGPRDPHSPHTYPNIYSMMSVTAQRYGGLVRGTIRSEPRFEAAAPEWKALDRFADRWSVRIGFGVLYTLVYIAFAPSWIWFLLLPAHYLMGPVHGAIVNWCGHKYGYRNFAGDEQDKSRNTLIFDFVTMGELFQNNHHKYGMSPDFAVRWFEVDPAWQIIRLFSALGIVKLAKRPQRMRWSPADRVPAPAALADAE